MPKGILGRVSVWDDANRGEVVSPLFFAVCCGAEVTATEYTRQHPLGDQTSCSRDNKSRSLLTGVSGMDARTIMFARDPLANSGQRNLPRMCGAMSNRHEPSDARGGAFAESGNIKCSKSRLWLFLKLRRRLAQGGGALRSPGELRELSKLTRNLTENGVSCES